LLHFTVCVLVAVALPKTDVSDPRTRRKGPQRWLSPQISGYFEAVSLHIVYRLLFVSGRKAGYA
jgi:hypothetical protein